MLLQVRALLTGASLQVKALQQIEVLLQVRTLLTEDSLQVKALLAGGVEALWTDELRIEVLHAEAL